MTCRASKLPYAQLQLNLPCAFISPNYRFPQLGSSERPRQHHAGLTRDPLNPDDIISPKAGCKFLQAIAVVVFYFVPFDLQVALGFKEERFHHVHQFHTVENWQQDVLADSSYARATVQGTVSPSSPRPLQKNTWWATSSTETHPESQTLQLPLSINFIWVNFIQ